MHAWIATALVVGVMLGAASTTQAQQRTAAAGAPYRGLDSASSWRHDGHEAARRYSAKRYGVSSFIATSVLTIALPIAIDTDDWSAKHYVSVYGASALFAYTLLHGAFAQAPVPAEELAAVPSEVPGARAAYVEGYQSAARAKRLRAAAWGIGGVIITGGLAYVILSSLNSGGDAVVSH